MSQLNLSNKVKNFQNFAMVSTTVLLITAIISSTISYASALPPTNGYNSSSSCTSKIIKSIGYTTCCYRKSTGVNLSETYCQTCQDDGYGASNCTEEELQFRTNSQGGIGTISPNDDGVLAESEESDEKTNNQLPNDDGVLAESEETNKGAGTQVPLEGGVFSKQP